MLPNKYIHNDSKETNQIYVANLYHTLLDAKITITLDQLHLECQGLHFPSWVLSAHSLGLSV